MTLRVLDLFAGLEGWSAPFRERGHEVYSVDIDERFDVDLHADVLELAPTDLPWRPDIVLASPPCEKFSILTFGRSWLPGYQPAHDGTRKAIELVRATVRLIDEFAPAFWVVENPVGMLRKLYLLPYERQTVTYCQYGAPWRKPTDLWGGFPPSLVLRQRCRNGDPCHVPSPRGSTTGVQGGGAPKERLANGSRVEAAWGWDARTGSKSAERVEQAAIRAQIPHALALDVCIAAERDHAAGLRAADYSGVLFA